MSKLFPTSHTLPLRSIVPIPRSSSVSPCQTIHTVWYTIQDALRQTSAIMPSSDALTWTAMVFGTVAHCDASRAEWVYVVAGWLVIAVYMLVLLV